MNWIVLAYLSGLIVTCGQKGPLQLPENEGVGANHGQHMTQTIHRTLTTFRRTERTMTP